MRYQDCRAVNNRASPHHAKTDLTETAKPCGSSTCETKPGLPDHDSRDLGARSANVPHHDCLAEPCTAVPCSALRCRKPPDPDEPGLPYQTGRSLATPRRALHCRTATALTNETAHRDTARNRAEP